MAAGRAEQGDVGLMATAKAIVSPSIHDPRLFYPSLGHQDAIPGSLIVVSGDEGIGNLLLLAVLLDTPSGSVAPMVVNDPSQDRPDTRFLRSLIELADGSPFGRTGLVLTSELMNLLGAIHARGRMAAILIDDAHRLSGSQLEILRTLLSSASASQPVHVVLFGEPELIEKISRKRRLAERVTMHHSLNPLNPDDALAMFNHRLNHAGIDDAASLFTAAALETLYTRSRGNPRSMFVLAERSLSAAIEANLDQIDAPLVQALAGARIGAEQHTRLPLGKEALAGDTQPPAGS